MKDLLTNIRFYIICFSLVLSAVIYFKDASVYQGLRLVTEVTQHYALMAFTFLYLTLLASPLVRLFTFLPYRGKYLKARRALGISTFYFGFLHANFAFWGELGGISAIGTLSTRYTIAILCAFIALIIFTIMAATANEKMVDKLTFPRWKMIHRFVYLAAILILIHATLIGTHFDGSLNMIIYPAVLFLLILEAIRFVRYLQNK
jgi:methionine sulfoxide reductase heme-binding subunit